MTEPRLCKDCKWAQTPPPELADPRAYDWVCGHAEAQRLGSPDLVTGRPVAPWQDPCIMVRRDPNRCGVTGRYWAAREG